MESQRIAMVVHLHIPVVSAGGFFDAFYAESMPRLSDFPVAGVMRFEEQARFHPLKFLARIAEEVEVCGQTKVLRVEDHRVETDRASERRPGADGVQEEVKGKGSVTVQPRTLHLLQSPYEHVNLAKKESAPRRRRFGMGRFRNREAEG